MTRPVVEIVYNPASARYSPARLAALRTAFERRAADVRLSPTGREPIAFASATSIVCALGGDGTARHVAMALQRAGRPIVAGFYPGGTVNLLSREAGHGRSPDAFAERLLQRESRVCYGVALNDTLFLACASAGPEARAVAQVSLRLKRAIGRLAYAVAFLRLLVRWPRERIVLRVGGRAIACESFHVANGRFFAGPWSLSRHAGLHTGRLQVAALRTARRRDVFRFWAAMTMGRDVGRLPFVEAFDCTAFDAVVDAPSPLQADGDIVAALPASFSVIETPFRFG